MDLKNLDLVIIGAGPAGYVAALRASQEGLSTALIEKEKIGGMCLNWGCIPSKSLQASAKLFERIKLAEQFGLTGVDIENVKPDWNKMNERADSIVKKLTTGVKTLLDKNGVSIINGKAELIDTRKLKVNDTEIVFKDLIIATGSQYPLPDFVDENAKDFYTPRNIYSIKELPKSMIITGAGVIGVEFAMLFSSLGVNVEIIEYSDAIMPYMDDDLIRALKQTLRKNKVKLHLGYKATKYSADGIEIENLSNNEKKLLKADVYLSALSRQGNLEGLDALIDDGMELHKGYIKTDLRGRTSLPHIYAVGDINGRMMLAHVASVEGTTAVDTILNKGKDLVYDMMPYNLYGKLELASVGLTEKEALERGFLTATGKFSLSANGKALAEATADGFVKVVYEKQYGELLGIHIAADNATDLIGESVMAMQLESTVWDAAAAVHPHPTMSEAFLEAVFKGIDKPLHTL